MRRVCVFCGSNPGASPEYVQVAERLGREIAERGIELVYGGAKVGTMGALADSALAAGGRVIGIMPQAIVEKEVAHEGLSELRVVGTMSERKDMMVEVSDAFIALPGGYGTLEELFEVLVATQLGFHRKPCGVVDVGGYYSNLLRFIDTMVEAGFVKPLHRDMIQVDPSPGALLDALSESSVPVVDKWQGRN